MNAERNYVANSIRKILIYLVARITMDFFSFKCGPIKRHEKQFTSLLVISSIASAGIVN